MAFFLSFFRFCVYDCGRGIARAIWELVRRAEQGVKADVARIESAAEGQTDTGRRSRGGRGERARDVMRLLPPKFEKLQVLRSPVGWWTQAWLPALNPRVLRQTQRFVYTAVAGVIRSLKAKQISRPYTHQTAKGNKNSP
jgi:hypothetical protein